MYRWPLQLDREMNCGINDVLVWLDYDVLWQIVTFGHPQEDLLFR